LAVAVEMLAASVDQPATERDGLPSAAVPWSGIAAGARDRIEAGGRAAGRCAVRCGDRWGVALGFAAGAMGRTSVQAARSGRHAATVAGRAAGHAGAQTGEAVRTASIRAGRATGRASMRAGEATGRASMRAGRATGEAGTRTARRAGSVARVGGAALVATAAKIEASTVAAIGAGKARTAAFVRRASASTRRTGARTASGTARAIRRGGGRATVATRRGTRRAASATRRAATHLVPDPVALPDEAPGRHGGPEPEPAAVAANPLPAQAVDAAPRATAVVSRGDEPPPTRPPRQGQVVPLRPRATTRLKATGELLVLVAFLGIAVSSISVAIVVAANQVLSGL
jgi:hypothetical protein